MSKKLSILCGIFGLLAGGLLLAYHIGCTTPGSDELKKSQEIADYKKLWVEAVDKGTDCELATYKQSTLEGFEDAKREASYWHEKADVFTALMNTTENECKILAMERCDWYEPFATFGWVSAAISVVFFIAAWLAAPPVRH